MPLDGYTLSFLVKELKNEITGNRIEKIHQPSKDEIIFHLRSRNGAKKLFFSVSSNYPRINLTENAPENPAVPPMFCMFMRKRLTGCVIDSIGQLGLDRTIYLDVSGTNEIGEPAGYRIWFEVMSKHSNFTITDTDGIILESLKKSDFSPNTGRQIQPGFKFILPPSQNKTNILVTDINDIVGNIKDHPNRKLSDALLSVLEGASPLISREIACSVTGNDSAVYDLTDYHYSKLEDELCKLRKELEGNGSPTLLCKDDNKPFDISFRDITQFGFSVTSKQMSGFSELTDLFFTEKTSAERSGQQGKELLKTLNNLLSRSMRKLEIRENELKECAEKDKYRIYAELILANQYSLVKGSLYYDVENFYDEYKSLRIPADPALSPAGNAQKYFKEYNKLKNAEKLLDNLIEESHTEITYLKSVIDAVERADGFTTISEIKNELYEEGYLKRNKNGKSAQRSEGSPAGGRSASAGCGFSDGTAPCSNGTRQNSQASAAA